MPRSDNGQITTAAMSLKMVYDEYISVGFKPNQALYLISSLQIGSPGPSPLDEDVKP